nr:DUF4153 domain-containing protein [Chromobacterium sp. ASV5]
METTTFRIRIGMGLAQGLLLYALYRALGEPGWLASRPLLASPLLLVCALIPPLAQIGLGAMPRRRLAAWLCALSAAVALMAAHDRWRLIGAPLERPWGNSAYPGDQAVAACIVFLLIAWPLALTRESERRWLAPYPAYFDAAWKLVLQLAYSGLFVGVFWLVLFLGAGLFELIGIRALQDWIQRSAFAIPASMLALSLALHVTDARPGIIRGMRNLLLALLGWLSPLLVALCAAFLLALPVVGLEALWQTRHACSLLLSAAAALVMLLNAVYQDGEARDVSAGARVFARLGCGLLPLLLSLAVYALGLRVVQYGWSPDRVAAAALATLGWAYALGYAWAALDRKSWLGGLAATNVAVAWLSLAMLLALFSPLADPARLSAASQADRLRTGKTPTERFDFDFLRFQALRYGQAELTALSQEAALPAQTRRLASLALAKRMPGEPRPPLAEPIKTVGGKALPAGFAAQDWKSGTSWRLPSCLTDKTRSCEAFVGNFSGGGEEVLLREEGQAGVFTLFQRGERGSWAPAAVFRADASCWQGLSGVRPDGIRALPSRLPDLEINGVRLLPESLLPERKCAPTH